MKTLDVICLRILVFSDSHIYGGPAMEKAIKNQPESKAVVFLGDGIRDFKSRLGLLSGKRFYCVRGNNDFYCDEPANLVIREGGICIYATHGHREYVKSGLSNLLSAAKGNGCSLALYGHTHLQKIDYINGIHLFNPGALANYQYGVVDISGVGFICICMEVF